jgi:hypothetical protein
VNLLDRRDYYAPGVVARIESLTPFAIVALLAARCAEPDASARQASAALSVGWRDAMEVSSNGIGGGNLPKGST